MQKLSGLRFHLAWLAATATLPAHNHKAGASIMGLLQLTIYEQFACTFHSR